VRHRKVFLRQIQRIILIKPKMYGTYINVAVSELLSTISVNFLIAWKFLLAALLVSLFFEFVLPNIKKFAICNRLAFRRANIDSQIKFEKEKSEVKGLRRYYKRLTRPIRKPIFFLNRNLFHYKKLRTSISRMNQFQRYLKRKNKNRIFRFISNYYTHVLLSLTLFFAIYFIYSQISQPV